MAKNKNGISAEDLKGLSESQINELLAKRGNYIQFIDNPTEQQCMIAVKNNGNAIRYIKEQTPELIDIIATKFPLAIQYVDNPTKEQIQKCFEKDPNVLQFIKNPTYEQQVNAVTRKGGTIQYIKKPDANLIKIAMQNEPMSLAYLYKKLSSEELRYWLKRVAKETPRVLKTVVNQAKPDELKYILSIHGYSLRHVNKKTEELCLIAVKNNPLAVRFVQKQTPAIQKAVIDSKNSEAIALLTIKDIGTSEYLIEKRTNAFHTIQDPSPEIIEKYSKEKIATDKQARKEFVKSGHTPGEEITLKEKYKTVLQTIDKNKSYTVEVLDNTFPIYKIINILCELTEPVKVDIATGYLFESGLGVLGKTFKTLSNRGIKANLTIGSLQNYRNAEITDDYVRDMDIGTAKLLNKYIKSNLIAIRTYEKNFYHGKYYCFKGENLSFTIIGSSNVSSSGLDKHRELNLLYIYHNSQDIINASSVWYDNFTLECTEISYLNEKCFLQKKVQSDTYELTRYDVQTQVKELSDTEQQARLNLWLSKNPTRIIKITKDYSSSFSDYIVLEYKNYNLCVLESLSSGNAFYCFNTGEFASIQGDIKKKSKIQLYRHPLLLKRGYHSADQFNMMLSINELF